ncbi:MAG: ATP-binding cassette domain-containing protein [Peptococcaceae bacterium]|jgi:energy-coupling factor transport system ATP-binding protein|nr:ATP-binding cassette domain-containing protein [Peptococcaceae bacterium]
MPIKQLNVDSISYGRVFREISFRVAQNETIAIMGRNGSGKSTLARVLAGLRRPSAGEIRLLEDGPQDDGAEQERWRRVALIGQHPRRQTIGATVTEELGFGLLNLGATPVEIREKVREILAELDMRGLAGQSPITLSGGERQRLVVAAFLLMEPAFIILDEALSMLDRRAEEKILALLKRRAARLGQIWLTHDADLAAKADRIFRLEDGLLREISKRQVLADRETEAWRKNGVSRLEPAAASRSETPLIEWLDAEFFAKMKVRQSVYAGDFIGILGASGSGKSTILESVAGLAQPEKGRILHSGRAAKKAEACGFVLQEAGEYVLESSVFREIYYGEKKKRLQSYRENAGELEEVFRRFGLEPSWADRSLEALSGGERQKVALAAALRNEPSLILLDEPLLGLDADSKGEILRIIDGWKRSTVLYAAHDLQEVAARANRLWLVDHGRVIFECPAQRWREHSALFEAAGVRYTP